MVAELDSTKAHVCWFATLRTSSRCNRTSSALQKMHRSANRRDEWQLWADCVEKLPPDHERSNQQKILLPTFHSANVVFQKGAQEKAAPKLQDDFRMVEFFNTIGRSLRLNGPRGPKLGVTRNNNGTQFRLTRTRSLQFRKNGGMTYASQKGTPSEDGRM